MLCVSETLFFEKQKGTEYQRFIFFEPSKWTFNSQLFYTWLRALDLILYFVARDRAALVSRVPLLKVMCFSHFEKHLA